MFNLHPRRLSLFLFLYSFFSFFYAVTLLLCRQLFPYTRSHIRRPAQTSESFKAVIDHCQEPDFACATGLRCYEWGECDEETNFNRVYDEF